MLVTEDGLKRLEEELQSLLQRRTSALNEFVTIVRTMESDTDHLPGEISLLDQRISQLQEAISHAIPVGIADREPGIVGVGSRVRVRWEDGGEDSLAIVGPPEVNPLEGFISYESPAGQALLGKRKGDCVEVNTPGGPKDLKVLDVE